MPRRGGPVSNAVDAARLRIWSGRDSLRSAADDFRSHGIVSAAVGLGQRFAGNNRRAIGLFSGRVSLGILRPPNMRF